MGSRLAIILAISMVGVGGCTATTSSPATTPPPSDATTTSLDVSTTAGGTTTTTVDRVAEIEAIFQDLEVRRLQAIMDQDEEAFRAVFANEEYEERSVGGMELVTVIDPEAVRVLVMEVFADEAQCIAAGVVVDGTEAIDGGVVLQQSDYVLEPTTEGWGFSWIGSGWRCGGPHPFSE